MRSREREAGRRERGHQAFPSVAHSRAFLLSISPSPYSLRALFRPPPTRPLSDTCPPTTLALHPSYQILEAVKDKFGETHVYKTAKM